MSPIWFIQYCQYCFIVILYLYNSGQNEIRIAFQKDSSSELGLEDCLTWIIIIGQPIPTTGASSDSSSETV